MSIADVKPRAQLRTAEAAEALATLLEVMARLRDQQGGCPWDLEQDFASIAPYTIEEAYEVADAIERDAMDELLDELGDLQLQVVFHAQMARERQLFDFVDVARAITAKMVRRHPHVFNREADPAHLSANEQTTAWEDIKAAERAGAGALEGVAAGLPALMRAQKVQRRAARVGFDWPDVSGVVAKVHEELAELEDELPAARPEGSPPNSQRQFEELGDLLFSAVNLSRHLGLDADRALRAATQRFEDRFTALEALAQAQGESVESLDIAGLEALWQRAKGRLARKG